MMANFDYAVQKTLKWEGGYVNNPKDPGGETNWGISKRQYPKIDIKNLTKDQAIKIYEEDYWRSAYNDIISPGVAYKIFDMAVLMGHKASHTCLQQALNNCNQNIAVDGLFGNKTLNAVNCVEVNELLKEYKIHLWERIKRIMLVKPETRVFENGWKKRIMD